MRLQQRLPAAGCQYSHHAGVHGKAAVMSTLGTAAILAAFVPACALAGAESDSNTTDQSMDLGQVVISATRTEQPLAKTGSSIAVITGADLDTRQLVAVSDALAQTPGVTTARTGGAGHVP